MIYFCEMLYRLQEKINIQWKKDKYWGNELRIHERKVSLEIVIDCFVKVFLYYRLNQMTKKIAQEKYFYRDKEEIERICVLTNWILHEKHFQSKLFPKHHCLKNYVYALIQQNVDETFPIHFDSLVTFCMQPFSTCLQEAVGYGIDEMKREEEHQNFVQSIREFIKRKTTKTKDLHIMQGETFSFYRPNGEKYSPFELRNLMSSEPLYIVGLDKNEMNLSPVITLLPKNIYIYGDHPSEAKTLTLINIFQERVTFLPKKEFPFHRKVK